MKTLTSMLVIVVFIYIVYKRRISPLLPKNKKKKTKTSGTDIQSKDTAVQQSIQQPFTSCQFPGMPLYGFTLDADIRYDIMVFNYIQEDPDSFFADRIETKLSFSISKMIENGYPYRIDFIVLGTALILIITYRINQSDIPVDISSKDAS